MNVDFYLSLGMSLEEAEERAEDGFDDDDDEDDIVSLFLGGLMNGIEQDD